MVFYQCWCNANPILIQFNAQKVWKCSVETISYSTFLKNDLICPIWVNNLMKKWLLELLGAMSFIYKAFLILIEFSWNSKTMLTLMFMLSLCISCWHQSTSNFYSSIHSWLHHFLWAQQVQSRGRFHGSNDFDHVARPSTFPVHLGYVSSKQDWKPFSYCPKSRLETWSGPN